MAYVPDWERLADALKRVTAATGIAEDEAQQDICGAIADREIRIRFCIAKEDAFPRGFVEGTVRNGEEVDIPIDLKPSDFDWKNSRAFKPWPIHADRRLAELNLASVTRYSKSASRFRAKWHLEWIELNRTDVTKVLIAAGAGRPVVEAKLKKPERGPVRGTTGYQASDRKLFPEITKLIENGEARSAGGAALMLKDKIAGPGSPENKAKRVAALYRKEHAADAR